MFLLPRLSFFYPLTFSLSDSISLSPFLFFFLNTSLNVSFSVHNSTRFSPHFVSKSRHQLFLFLFHPQIPSRFNFIRFRRFPPTVRLARFTHSDRHSSAHKRASLSIPRSNECLVEVMERIFATYSKRWINIHSEEGGTKTFFAPIFFSEQLFQPRFRWWWLPGYYTSCDRDEHTCTVKNNHACCWEPRSTLFVILLLWLRSLRVISTLL